MRWLREKLYRRRLRREALRRLNAMRCPVTGRVHCPWHPDGGKHPMQAVGLFQVLAPTALEQDEITRTRQEAIRRLGVKR